MLFKDTICTPPTFQVSPIFTPDTCAGVPIMPGVHHRGYGCYLSCSCESRIQIRSSTTYIATGQTKRSTFQTMLKLDDFPNAHYSLIANNIHSTDSEYPKKNPHVYPSVQFYRNYRYLFQFHSLGYCSFCN